MRALAFYLPQFHPIPENDRWWGPGFTEWTNVVRARAAFAGHHQPQLPADLGFYDLRCRETRHAQAALARAYGLHGFCYYHYWFNGTRLLDRPLLDLLDDAALDFPFCVCWANENWTRRWDGRDDEILMAQQYEAYDPHAHMAWLARAFADPRYVRVHGRPVFLVYRVTDLPDVRATIQAWRQAALSLGFDDPYVCAMANSQTALSADALLALGFDGVVEFEPNLRDVQVSRAMPEAPGMHVYRYRTLAERAMARPASDAPVFPCVFPSWDNTARRGWRATCIQNDDAELYAQWIARACQRVASRPHDERMIFVNAWNEWAEGCHLEPDLAHGHLFLRATAQGLGLDASEHAPRDETHAASADTAAPADVDVRLDPDRPLYVWGTGAAGRRVAEMLEAADVSFAGFLDNNREAWGRRVLGRPVVPPADVMGRLTTSAAPPFILIGSMAQDAIGRDIERAGGQLARHYLPDAGDLGVQRVHTPAPGHLRLGTWRRPACPICLSPTFTGTVNQSDAVCTRCQSTEAVRLSAVLFCDRFDWAHAPVADVAPHPHVKVQHVADAAAHVGAFESLVHYERTDALTSLCSRDVDLLLVAGVDEPAVRAAVQHAAATLRPGGQLMMTDTRGRRMGDADLAELARAYGLLSGKMDRDWPGWAVGRTSVCIFRRP